MGGCFSKISNRAIPGNVVKNSTIQSYQAGIGGSEQTAEYTISTYTSTVGNLAFDVRFGVYLYVVFIVVNNLELAGF